VIWFHSILIKFILIFSVHFLYFDENKFLLKNTGLICFWVRSAALFHGQKFNNRESLLDLKIAFSTFFLALLLSLNVYVNPHDIDVQPVAESNLNSSRLKRFLLRA
jgi:hypothetical protein